MAKMPFFPFYPLDWLRDTRKLSHEARGIWIDILALAWNEPKRGVYQRRDDMAAKELGLEFCGNGKCEDEVICAFHRVIGELSYVGGVTIRNFEITVISDRMVREETARNYNAKKQDDFRRNHKVTEKYAKVTAKKLEVRSQKLEVIKRKDVKAGTMCKPKIAFSKPTPEEVTAYAQSIGFDLEGALFCAHYESNGWKVGRNPMKSWRSAVVTWKHSEYRTEGKNAPNGSAGLSLTPLERTRAREAEEIRKREIAGKQVPTGV